MYPAPPVTRNAIDFASILSLSRQLTGSRSLRFCESRRARTQEIQKFSLAEAYSIIQRLVHFKVSGWLAINDCLDGNTRAAGALQRALLRDVVGAMRRKSPQFAHATSCSLHRREQLVSGQSALP